MYVYSVTHLYWLTHTIAALEGHLEDNEIQATCKGDWLVRHLSRKSLDALRNWGWNPTSNSLACYTNNSDGQNWTPGCSDSTVTVDDASTSRWYLQCGAWGKCGIEGHGICQPAMSPEGCLYPHTKPALRCRCAMSPSPRLPSPRACPPALYQQSPGDSARPHIQHPSPSLSALLKQVCSHNILYVKEYIF